MRSTDRIGPPCLAAILCLAMAPRAMAGEDPIHVRLTDDVPATLVLAAGWLTLTGLQSGIAGHRCGWCMGPGPVDRAFRTAFLAPDPRAAATASDVLLFGVAPAFALAMEGLAFLPGGGGGHAFGEDLAITVEAMMLAAFLTQAVKIAVRRERPYVRYGGDHPLYGTGTDGVLGFFSLHASLAATLAASTATLAFLRKRRGAAWIAAAGAALAVVTGLMRISGDKHYVSDVIVGLAAGSAIGVAIPLLHALPLPHRKPGDPVVAVLPGPGSLSVVGSF